MSQSLEAVLRGQRQLRILLDDVEVGDPVRHEMLRAWPLLGGRQHAHYDLLSEVNGRSEVEVIELNGGSVPEVQLRNGSDKPIFLAEGEELLGAMQNRSLNLSILAPAGATTNIPVSCMEAGRWGYDEEDLAAERLTYWPGAPVNEWRAFGTSDHVVNASLRMQRMDDVSHSLRSSSGRTRRSDQSGEWSRIDALANDLGAPSETGALNDAFRQHEEPLDAYTQRLQFPKGACGAIFEQIGGPHGLDIFDSQSTFETLQSRLVRSWALDAIAASKRRTRRGKRTEVNPQLLIDRLARSRCEVFPAVGIGHDIRLQRPKSRLQGAGLIADSGAVHVSAFHRGFN